ncbi:MAG TPA: ABC transporter ATP-binding protein [Sphingomicrobium sp.]
MGSAQSRDLHTLYRSLSPARRRQLLVLALLMPAATLAEMLMIAAIVPFLAALVPAANHESVLEGSLGLLDGLWATASVGSAAALFILVAMLAAAMRLLLSWASLRLAADLGHDLNVEIQRRMLDQPYLYHVSSHSSRLLAAPEMVDEVVLNFALRGLQFISASVMTLGLIAALLLVDAQTALIAILLVAALYGIAWLIARRRYRRLSQYLPGAQLRRIKLLQESLGGIRDIILDRSQDAHVAQFREVDRTFTRARTDISFLGTAPRFLVEGIGLSLLALAAIIVAGDRGGLMLALPTIGALALGALRLMPLASQLYSGWVTVAAAGPIVAEVAGLLDLPVSDQPAVSEPLAFNHQIELKGVGFRYTGRKTPALHDVNLTISAGSRIAIVGQTGSGKSTLADILMGLIEPTEGDVRVDGALLTGPTLGAWRKSVAHVSQFIFLADASIARNIALGADPDGLDMSRVEQAAASAQLDQFVATLPDGYRASVGEQGVRLSGGQRQRLALARAIYRRPRLLVLDEATSALDDETEAAVLTSLDRIQAEGCTIVIVAHRLSTVQRCDRIFLVDDGCLVRSGSFAELFGPLNQLRDQGAL